MNNSLDFLKKDSIESLDLRKKTLEIVLEKKNLINMRARVAVVIDKSGSMRKLYKNGSVQNTIERLFPIAQKFDDNGELDLWLFNDEYMRMQSVTKHNFSKYVDEIIMKGASEKFWGETKFAPVMIDVFNKYINEDPSHVPTYVIFITDGENTDKKITKQVITEASEFNIFWQFVGIGEEKFEFLKRLDDLKGRHIDNADFFEVNELEHIQDSKLYELLLNEYPLWIEESKNKGVRNGVQV